MIEKIIFIYFVKGVLLIVRIGGLIFVIDIGYVGEMVIWLEKFLVIEIMLVGKMILVIG